MVVHLTGFRIAEETELWMCLGGSLMRGLMEEGKLTLDVGPVILRAGVPEDKTMGASGGRRK